MDLGTCEINGETYQLAAVKLTNMYLLVHKYSASGRMEGFQIAQVDSASVFNHPVLFIAYVRYKERMLDAKET
jgi:hypothetical protein